MNAKDMSGLEKLVFISSFVYFLHWSCLVMSRLVGILIVSGLPALQSSGLPNIVNSVASTSILSLIHI